MGQSEKAMPGSQDGARGRSKNTLISSLFVHEKDRSVILSELLL